MKFKFTNLLNGEQEVLKIKKEVFPNKEKFKVADQKFCFSGKINERYLLYC